MSGVAGLVSANAAELRRLNERIDETLSFRDRSAKDRAKWSRACAEFHARFSELSFPGGGERWNAFLEGDSSEVETAVVFLEADPEFFRSGYIKEEIWKQLKRTQLSSKQLHRLQAVAIAYLRRCIRRQFWYMVRWARQHAAESFWHEVSELARPENGSVGFKAHWLLLARRNLPVQNWVSEEYRRAKYNPDYTANYWFSDRDGRRTRRRR
ncbi:MAG: hypothetical protein ACR2RB_03140 [Gammaproteobacteria bacterium]